MAGDREMLKPELLHHRDEDRRHVSLRSGRRRRTATVTGQIGGDDGEIVGERGRHRMPHRVCLRVPVQQQQWPSSAAAAHADPADLEKLEPLEQWRVAQRFSSRRASDAADVDQGVQVA